MRVLTGWRPQLRISALRNADFASLANEEADEAYSFVDISVNCSDARLNLGIQNITKL